MLSTIQAYSTITLRDALQRLREARHLPERLPSVFGDYEISEGQEKEKAKENQDGLNLGL